MTPANPPPEKDQTEPLVSAVVCVYNAGPYFKASLQSLLDQTYPSLEILVVDDGSTDGCLEPARELLKDPRVRLFSQPNAGKPTALNRALEEMKGEYYLIHDADDLSHPRRVERLVACFLKDPALGLVMSGHELLIGDRTLAPTIEGKSTKQCRFDIDNFRQPAHDPTAMYRVSKVRGLTYNPELIVGEGYDYILRVGEKHPVRVVDGCWYSYRIHPESITKTTDRSVTDKQILEVVEQACQRRGVPVPERFLSAVAAIQAGKIRNQDVDNNLAAHFIDSAVQLCRAGRRREAISNSLYCSRLHPTDFHYQKALLYSILPVSVVNRIRSKRTLPPGQSANQ